MNATAVMAMIKTGIDELDRAHEPILTCLTEVANAIDGPGNVDVIMDIILRLKDMTEQHFHEEESMMENSVYEMEGHHKKVHYEYLMEIDKLLSGIEETGQCPPVAAIVALATWLQEHMRTMDLDLAG